MCNCIAYSKPDEGLFVTFTHAWYIRGVCGLGAGAALFLLFLGHTCASVLFYFRIFSITWCIFTTITPQTPCSSFSISALSISPPPLLLSPPSSLGIQSRPYVGETFSLCIHVRKAELLDVIVCPWNDVDAIGFTGGPECWMRGKPSGGEWLGDGSESEHTWGEAGAALELKIRHFTALYSPLVPPPWWWKTPLQMKDGNEQ